MNKYPELIGVCKNCLGCNKLELEDFRGVYHCKWVEPKEINWKQEKIEL